MIKINAALKVSDLSGKLNTFWKLSGEKLRSLHKGYLNAKGSPVYTINGRYVPQRWTEWTRGFQFGSALLQFEATGDPDLISQCKKDTIKRMSPHLTHMGVHDHGFNNISTYGNLLRLMNEGKIPYNSWEKNVYELALKISGAVQASRWTKTREGGFIYSFNGPHSLFVDTIRSCRILILSHLLKHSLKAENDVQISLFDRALDHIKTTALYSVYYGEGRDWYDIRGRVAHESLFNTNDGSYRCPSTQQGYSAFTTWTRGLAWAMLGFAEQLEFLHAIPDSLFPEAAPKESWETLLLKPALATCDFYIDQTPVDGIPYWDTGAPDLWRLGDYLNRKADPFNDYEPVDSSAGAIAAQGLLRLGNYLKLKRAAKEAEKYWQAGLTVFNSLLDEPYLSKDTGHQGLILHSVYHRPNGWDHIPAGKKIPCGESSMWGDYHAREVALYIHQILKGEGYYTFYNGLI